MAEEDALETADQVRGRHELRQGLRPMGQLAARSVNSLNKFVVAGPSGYDHQAHEARPGFIHEVSPTRDGGARSVTSVAVAMSPAVFPRAKTRQGRVHGKVNLGSGPN